MSQKTLDKVAHIKKSIEDNIPEDVVTAEHTATEHWYRHNPSGRLFSSVTTKTGILGNPRLKRWAANLAVEYLDKNWEVISELPKRERKDHHKAAVLSHEDTFRDAGHVGTEGHEVVERYLLKWMETGERPRDIKDFIIGTDTRLWAIARSAERFCIDYEIIPIAAELRVASEKYGFAGTLDSLMMVKTDKGYIFAIVDFKTSNSVDKPEYCMQVSAYRQALNEMTRTDPKKASTGLSPKELLILQLDKKVMKYKLVRVIDRVSAFKAFVQCTKIHDYLNDGLPKITNLKHKKEIFLT